MLYIYSGGLRHPMDVPKVAAVREYLSTVIGFQSITIINSPLQNQMEFYVTYIHEHYWINLL